MAEAGSFPVRIAAVDIGSNAIRFLAVEFSEPRHYHVLAQRRLALRLGHDVFAKGVIGPQSCAALLDALAQFTHTMDDLHAQHRRVVATSAVRDSRNGAEFVGRARNEVATEIDVVSGEEEARLVYTAIRHRVPLRREKWLLVDLGGGSLEISLIDASRIYASETHRLGAVRLLEETTNGGTEDVRRHVQQRTEVLRQSALLGASHGKLIATGGNIEALAALAHVRRKRQGAARLPIGELTSLGERLAGLSCADRIRQLGLRPDRADVILPAALVYERVAALAHADSITVPYVGLKEGIVLDLLERRMPAAS
ncbi:MAG TPA: hypothetical protein VF021_04120 [Longimicrobiales bacterium]